MIHRWLRKRFGPNWPTHVVVNIVYAWGLVLLLVTTHVFPTWVLIVAIVLAVCSSLNSLAMFVVRYQAERLGILEHLDRETARAGDRPACQDLAEHFLAEEPYTPDHEAEHASRVVALAEAVQQAVEDWLQENPRATEASR